MAIGLVPAAVQTDICTKIQTSVAIVGVVGARVCGDGCADGHQRRYGSF